MTRMIDPTYGWMYGFPKPIPDNVTDVLPWLVENGYPQSAIDACGENFFCRYWEIGEHAKEALVIKQNGYIQSLLINPDGEEATAEITRLRERLAEADECNRRVSDENEKLRAALEPFAEKYQDNGLTHSMYIFEMKDLLTAKKVLEA